MMHCDDCGLQLTEWLLNDGSVSFYFCTHCNNKVTEKPSEEKRLILFEEFFDGLENSDGE